MASQSVSALIVGCKIHGLRGIAAIADLPSILLETGTRVMSEDSSEPTFSERVEEIREDGEQSSDYDVEMGPAKTIAIVLGGLFGIGMVIGALTSDQPVFSLFVVFSIAIVVFAVIAFKNGDDVTDAIQESNKQQQQGVQTNPEEKISCQKCGWQNPRNNDFCHDCGGELKTNE